MGKINIKNYKGNRLHVVDVNAVAATKYWAFKDLSYVTSSNELVKTGILYGVLSIFKEIPLGDKVIFCFDSMNNSRKEENDMYKSGRVSLGDDFHNQLSFTQSVLYKCGFDVLQKRGFEADDLVVGAVNVNIDLYDYIFVYTNDNDLAQLISNKVILKVIGKKRKDITIDNYEEEVGLPYNTVILYKALVGCRSDKVSGVKGFGYKAFKVFLKELQNEYDLCRIRENNAEKEIIEKYFDGEQKEQALESLNLVLPRYVGDYFYSTGAKFDEKLFRFYLKEYGMHSILDKI